MDVNLDRDSSTVDSLFYLIINDIKSVAPIWEDFVTKTNKFHSSLRCTIQSMSAYLDVFQKIADTATNSKGASKEIGTVLTRVCLRHKSVENKLKSFTLSLMNSLIIPLQSQLDEWHRDTQLLERNYTKQQKRGRADLKKYSSDTIRLKKKNKKGQTDTIQSLIETSMKTINVKNDEIATLERTYLRDVMVDERRRYCVFVNMLQPVVKEGCEIMFELGHLQEAMDSIANVIQNPNTLPASVESKIVELKLSGLTDHPLLGPQSMSNSIGSRKNSGSSINSFISNDSRDSLGIHTQRSVSQASSAASSNLLSTWPAHASDSLSYLPSVDTPSTISSNDSLQKRSALTELTFQSPGIVKSTVQTLSRPPLPIRCSSLERAKQDTTTGISNSTKESHTPVSSNNELSCGRHTYVNTMDCYSNMTEKPITDTTAATHNLPVPSPESIQPPPPTVYSSNMNGLLAGHNPIEIYSEKPSSYKPPENRFGELNGVGSVLKKLTIFEKIKLLNADASQDDVKEPPPPLIETPVFKLRDSGPFVAQSKPTDETTHTQRSSTRVKPAPPVRRSSSVTPNTSYGFKSSFETSTENIPYALQSNDNYLRSPGKICNTIKALVDKCHVPISPGAIRRNSVITNAHSIYGTTAPSNFNHLSAQTSINTKHNLKPTTEHLSSFKNNISDASLPNTNTYASLYAGPTDTTDKHKEPHLHRSKPPTPQQLQQHQHQPPPPQPQPLPPPQQYFKPNPIYGAPAEVIYATPNDFASTFKQQHQPSPNSINPKTHIATFSKRAAESLKSELDLSQKAFAVRKLINRQAVADPRQCHESLMSQIKRGTILHSSKSIKESSQQRINTTYVRQFD